MSSLTEVDRSQQARSSPQAPSPAYIRSGRGSIAASTCGMDRQWNFGPATPVRCAAEPPQCRMTTGRLGPADVPERAWAADKRDFVADRRDEVADQRDRVTDSRDRTGDDREAELDKWERQLDARAAQLGGPPEESGASAQRVEARAGRSQARQNRN